MSYIQYEELRLQAEANGRYKIYVFDIENSKKMTSGERRAAQIISEQLLENIYKRIMCLEYQLQMPILHHNQVFNNESIRWDMNEPFIVAGDSFGFTIIKDTLKDEVVFNIMAIEKDKLDIEFNYHISTGCYDTDLYKEGGQLYFRGYCIQEATIDKSKRLTKI